MSESAVLTGELVITDQRHLTRVPPMTEQTVNQQSIDAGTTAGTNVSTTGAAAQQQTTAQEHHAEVNRRGMENDQKFAQNLSEQQTHFAALVNQQNQLFAASMQQMLALNQQTVTSVINQGTASRNNSTAEYYATLGTVTILP